MTRTLLALLGLLLLPAFAVQAQSYTNNGFIYTVTNATATIRGYNGSSRTVTIPTAFTNAPVTAIGSNAFANATVFSVTIPGSVASIGSTAFFQCASLTNAAISNGVTNIGDNAFQNCTRLSKVTIPDSVTNLGNAVFSGCTGLSNVTIGQSVSGIGVAAFFNCTNLPVVTLPNSVSSIGNNAFQQCFKLTNVTMGSSVSSIGDGAFFECVSLAGVTLPNSVSNIGNNAFEECYNLTNITIPNAVSNLGNGAFFECISLAGATLGNSVSSIKGSTFYDCVSLTNLTIPNNVSSIGDSAFSGCTGLAGVTIPGSVTNIGDNAFYECSSLGGVTIPERVTSIGSWAFYDCSSLTSVKIPDSVTGTIDAFMFCTSLTNVIIGSNVTSIGPEAFAFCTNLAGVTIPNRVSRFGNGAFEECYSLPSLTIPASVSSIGNDAFSQCFNLTNVFFEGREPFDGGGVFYEDPALSAVLYVYGTPGWKAKYSGVKTAPCTISGAPLVGTMQVTITPAAALADGAKWQADNGTTNDSGVTLTNLLVISHTVTFASVAGWNAPVKQTIMITNGAIAQVRGVYKAWPSNSAVLVVHTNGNGTFQHGPWPPQLFNGKTYTVTAVPARNWVLTNWIASGSGSFVSNSPVLNFTMMSNLVLQANFVPNPFLAIKGAYNGLFYQTNANSPVTEQSSGFATITIGSASKGAYSAVVKVDGGSYSCSGMFDLKGNSVANIKRAGKSPLTLTLHVDLNLDPPADSMIGSVEATNWAGLSTLVANLAGATQQASSYAGKYTLALPGSTNDPASSPGGYSVAEFTNNLAGNAVLTGALADNTAITSLSTPISRDGSVPIYYSRAAGAAGLSDVIFGWLSFANQAVSGELTWFKLPTTSKASYSNGFTIQTNVIGSVYAPAPSGTLVTNGTLTIVDPGQALDLVYTNVAIVSNKLSYAAPPTNQLTATITASTGAISLSFRPTGARTNLTAQGVLFQDSPSDPSLKAAGWFTGTNQSGYFILTD